MDLRFSFNSFSIRVDAHLQGRRFGLYDVYFSNRLIGTDKLPENFQTLERPELAGVLKALAIGHIYNGQPFLNPEV